VVGLKRAEMLTRYFGSLVNGLHVVVVSLLLLPGTTRAGIPLQDAPDTPSIGQDGKDVPWVPTPPELIDKMLDMANVTAEDVVIDLGSGDGRTVIAAAQRGAKAIGVELEPNLILLSERRAAEAGVSDKTEFITADLFDVDLSVATVISMFLLPDINLQLRPSLLALNPGTRIVSNTWDLTGTLEDPEAPGWSTDETIVIDPCPTWCTSHLWIVPAEISGNWQLGNSILELDQKYQTLSGTLRTQDGATPIGEGRLRGLEINFTVDGLQYRGTVDGDTMSGGANNTRWNAHRLP